MAKTRVRANREGTIYERTRTVKGREYRLYIAEITWTDEHDRVRRLRAERAKREDAVQELHRMRDQVRAGRVPAADVARRTVGDIMERWLADAERRRLRPATLRSYRQVVSQHIIPRICNVRATALTRGHITAWLDDLAADGVGQRSAALAYVVAKSALAHHVVADPHDHPFPRRGGPRSEKRSMTVWSEEEVRRFLRAAKDDRYYALFLLALSTGMRQGEMLGLRWGDVHAEHITIRGSLDPRTRQIAATKTAGSRRRVEIGAEIAQALDEHRTRMRAEGHRVGRDDLVFVTEAGTAVHASNLYRRAFAPLMEAARVAVIRFHDLRHTAATIMLARGVNVKVVSERLGHSSIRLTLDTYSHVLPTMQRSAVEATADLFRTDLPLKPVGPRRGALPGKTPR